MKSNNLTNFEYLKANMAKIEYNIYIVRTSIMICNALNITIDILTNKNRKNDLVLNRIVFAKLMILKKARICDISEILNIHHSTIQYYKNLELKYDKKLSELYYKTEKNLLY
jgi:hypothetical protein